MNLLTVVGNRPQFIKAAPVSRAMMEAGVSEVLLHTGQHYDERMSEIFFSELDLPKPEFRLDIGSGSHGKQTGEMLMAIEDVLQAHDQDAVLVYGDTNSTLAGALAASKLGVPVIHVEAGLRSYNRVMPEEINRITTDHLSELLFCPTDAAVSNLAKEGITHGVHQTGDVMLDAARFFGEISVNHSALLEDHRLEPDGFVLVTLHRAENADCPVRLGAFVRNLEKLSEKEKVLFAVHPRTKSRLAEFGLDNHLEGVITVEPLSFFDMIEGIRAARVVITDSGGLQKETYFHRTPCITIRSETEWMETVEAGWNQLLEPESADFVDLVASATQGHSDIADYGEGKAAERIARIVAAR
jgi:UDP-GlcNAc3NAcA epimerase